MKKMYLVVFAMTVCNFLNSQNLVYDNQDNVRKFNNQWQQSWDLVNDVPANQNVSVKIDIDDDLIIIQSSIYYLVNVNFLNNIGAYDVDHSADYRTLYINYYNLNQHIANDILFNFDLRYTKKKRVRQCLDKYIIGKETKGKCTYNKTVYIYDKR